jgi:hypothetical protein
VAARPPPACCSGTPIPGNAAGPHDRNLGATAHPTHPRPHGSLPAPTSPCCSLTPTLPALSHDAAAFPPSFHSSGGGSRGGAGLGGGSGGGASSDYINASYVKDSQGREGGCAYIATQGPLPQTVVDFWDMLRSGEAGGVGMGVGWGGKGRRPTERGGGGGEGVGERRHAQPHV